MSNMGDQVWLMTSRHTEPELYSSVSMSCVNLIAKMAALQFIYVWVENSVDEADAGAFVWILIWKLYMDLP